MAPSAGMNGHSGSRKVGSPGVPDNVGALPGISPMESSFITRRHGASHSVTVRHT